MSINTVSENMLISKDGTSQIVQCIKRKLTIKGCSQSSNVLESQKPFNFGAHVKSWPTLRHISKSS